MNSDYEYTPLYYSTPCFVKYLDSNQYSYGITWKDYLIKHDGEIEKIEEEINRYSSTIHFDNIIIEMGWKDLNEL